VVPFSCMFLIAQMIRHLGVQHPLHQAFRQFFKQPVLP
jgi:hypothetical protein